MSDRNVKSVVAVIASVPVRGLFVLESAVAEFKAFATDWAARHASVLDRGASASRELASR